MKRIGEDEHWRLVMGMIADICCNYSLANGITECVYLDTGELEN